MLRMSAGCPPVDIRLRMTMKNLLTTLIAAGHIAAPIAAADETADQRAILDVIDAFFAGMTAKDVEGMRSIMTEDGILYGYRETADGLAVFNPTHNAYLESLADRDTVLIERYWNPEFKIHDRLAVVWTPYDLYSDGEFVHCGINSFSLLRMESGWKIAGVVFSMEPDDCEPSPLGPLQKSDTQ